mmetsp:Transcript_32398/g.70155  ORF Transcript_32398/g.70155 Transcript_32398/m.70155 type:complete len:319 (-) Transcript_32398:629-1585(-)
MIFLLFSDFVFFFFVFTFLIHSGRGNGRCHGIATRLRRYNVRWGHMSREGRPFLFILSLLLGCLLCGCGGHGSLLGPLRLRTARQIRSRGGRAALTGEALRNALRIGRAVRCRRRGFRFTLLFSLGRNDGQNTLVERLDCRYGYILGGLIYILRGCSRRRLCCCRGSQPIPSSSCFLGGCCIAFWRRIGRIVVVVVLILLVKLPPINTAITIGSTYRMRSRSTRRSSSSRSSPLKSLEPAQMSFGIELIQQLIMPLNLVPQLPTPAASTGVNSTADCTATTTIVVVIVAIGGSCQRGQTVERTVNTVRSVVHVVLPFQ